MIDAKILDGFFQPMSESLQARTGIGNFTVACRLAEATVLAWAAWVASVVLMPGFQFSLLVTLLLGVSGINFVQHRIDIGRDAKVVTRAALCGSPIVNPQRAVWWRRVISALGVLACLGVMLNRGPTPYGPAFLYLPPFFFLCSALGLYFAACQPTFGGTRRRVGRARRAVEASA